MELGILSFKSRRKHFDLIQTYKILNGIDKVDKGIWFNTVGNDIQRITRNTAYHNNLVPQRVRTDVRKYFFSNRVVKIWNQLPVEIKDSRSLNIFKTSLRKLQF